MLTLHYLEKSRAHRIVWLLEELKVPYEVKLYRRDPKTMLAPESLKEVHPSGKSPLITDGDDTVAESGIICDYLIDKYGQGTELAPRDKVDARQINYGSVVAESNFMIAGMQLLMFKIVKEKLPFGLSQMVGFITNKMADAYATKEFDLNLKNLNDTIKANNGFYASGRLTAADIMFENNITLATKNGIITNLEQKYPEIASWKARLAARPAYQAAKKKEKELEAK